MKTAILEQWERISEIEIKNLVESMKNRVIIKRIKVAEFLIIFNTIAFYLREIINDVIIMKHEHAVNYKNKVQQLQQQL